MHLGAVEIDGAEIIPIGDAAEDSLERRVVEDVPVERVADSDEPGLHGGGVFHDGGLGVIVGLAFQRAHQVQPFFQVVVGLFGPDEFFPNLEIQNVDVAQVFHVTDEAVGHVHGGQVAPVCSRLRKQGKVDGVLHLLEPFTRIDVVDAQLLEALVQEVMGGKHLLVMVLRVGGDVLGIDQFLPRLQQHKKMHTEAVEDLLGL